MSFAQALNRLWPRAKQSVRDGVVRVAPRVFAENGITTPLLVAHVMAQISHECGAGTIIRENMNYSASRMMQIFGVGVHSAKITPEEAQRLQGHPQEIADRVYGIGNPKKAKEFGHTKPGDGYKYRGNGMLQLTGKSNHKHVGDLVGFDLVNHPEMLEDPAISFEVAVKEFVALNCVPAANQDNISLVTRWVNGGQNGLSDRTVWLRKWKEALPNIEEPAWKPRAAEPEGHTSIWQSNIVRGGITAATSAATGLGAKVAQNGNVEKEEVPVSDIVSKVSEKVNQAKDVVTTVSEIKNNTTAIVETAKPVLGIGPNIWGQVAIFAGGLTFALVLFMIYKRVKMWREQGV